MARSSVEPGQRPHPGPVVDWESTTATGSARPTPREARAAAAPPTSGRARVPGGGRETEVLIPRIGEERPPALREPALPVATREFVANAGPAAAAPGGRPLSPGETLQTGDTDRVFIELPDGGQVVVGFDTQVEIAKAASLGGDDGFSVRLAQGDVWAWSPGDGGKISVLTPKGSGRVHRGQAIVRFLDPRVAPLRARGSPLEVLACEGGVEFVDPAGNPTALRPGQVMLADREPMGLDLEPQAFKRIIEVAGGWGRRKDAWQVWPLTGADLLSQLDAPRVGLDLKLVGPPGDESGLQVAAVLPDSTAEQAGLRPGDVILTVGHVEVKTLRDVAAGELLLANREVRAISVRRGDAELSLGLLAAVSLPTLCDPGDTAVGDVAALAVAGEVERAADQCARLANARPTSAGYWYNLGLFREYQDRLGDALAAYKRAQALGPNQPQILVALGRLYARIGNLGQARALLLKADEVHPSASTRYLLGRVAIFGMDFAGTEYWSNQLLASDSDEDKAWGEVLADQLAYARSDHERAMRRAEHALALDPGNLRAMYDVASRTFQARGAREARELLRPLLRLCPDLLAAINLMGNAARRMGEWQEAKSRFEQGIDLHRRSASLLCNRARVAIDEGNPEDAVPYYEEAIKADPSFVAAYIGLGDAAAEVGRPSVAAEHFEKALRLAPGDSEVLDKAVKARKALGQDEEAERLLVRYELPAIPH